MDDKTRQHDLEELGQARDSSNSTEDREKYDKMMYDIKSMDDEEIIEQRQDLAQAMRSKDGTQARKISDKIKDLAHQKGIEKKG